jgi:hypothetical protein
MKKGELLVRSGFAHIGFLAVVLVLPLLVAANYLYTTGGFGRFTVPKAADAVPGRGGTGNILTETWDTTTLYDNDAPKPGAGVKTWVRSMTIDGCSTQSILSGPCQWQTETNGPLRNTTGVGIDIIPYSGRKVARFWLQQNTGHSHGARLIIANNITDNAFLRPWGNRRIYGRFYMMFPQQLPIAQAGGSWMSIGVEMKDQKLDQRAAIQQNIDRDQKFWQAFAQNNINQSFTNTDHVFQGNRWYKVDVIWDMFSDPAKGKWQTYIDGVKLAESSGKMAHDPDGYGFWIFNLYGDMLRNQERGEMYIGDVVLSTQPIVDITSPSTPIASSAPAPVGGTDTSNALWVADHEEGIMNDWYKPGSPGATANACGGEFNSVNGTSQASTEQKHSGNYSAKLTVNASGTDTGARLFRWCESQQNTALYYSGWFYFPQRVNVTGGWWNVFQWKSKTAPGSVAPMMVFNVGNRADGNMYLYMYDWQKRATYSQSVANLPVNKWVHLEAYYKSAQDNTGQVTMWQDGTQILNVSNVQTQLVGGDTQWSLDNYSNTLSPSLQSIYVDDAVISKTRVGNGGAPAPVVTTPQPIVTPVPVVTTPRPIVTVAPVVATPRPVVTLAPAATTPPVVAAPSTTVPKNAFKGTYYNNKDFTDQKFVRTDSSVNFNWAYGSPDAFSIGPDTFSVRWEGDWDFATSGVYEFNVTTDDGMRIYVDNNLVLDQWKDQYGSHKFNVNINQGTHRIRVDYYDNTVYSTAIANWKLIAAATPVPTPVRTAAPVAVATPAPAVVTNNGYPVNAFRAIYYNNSNYTDQKIIRTDAAINFNWAWGSPSLTQMAADTFSVRWDGNWDFAESGNYQFDVTTDDGMTIDIDGQSVLNKWFDQYGNHTFTKYLTAGRHYIKVGYYENGGYSTAIVKWKKI